LRLSEEERRILAGKSGPAARLALSVLVELGELFGAREMVQVAMAHDDSVIFVGQAGIEFAEHLVELGGRVSVPTSLNACDIDFERWAELRVPPRALEVNRRIARAHLALGAAPTWTCAPYQAGLVPRFGQHIAWAESNAVAFANSIIGARTNRYPGLIDLCAAIAGRVPKYGLHLRENRQARVLIRLSGLTKEMLALDSIYPLLGYLLGEIAGDRVAALAGLPAQVGMDSLKGFSAAAASSGAVGLFHLVGLTPEAQTLEACLDGPEAVEETEITPRMIARAQARLSPADPGEVDLVALGCPHFSFQEFMELARYLEGRRVHGHLALWAFTSRAVYGWLKDSGLLEKLKNAGAMVFTDGCPLAFPREAWEFKAVMTNSAKMANYCFAQTGLKAVLGGLRDCLETALAGRVRRRETPWDGF